MTDISTINYKIDFTRFNEHLIDIVLTFTASTDAPCIWLPAWIPGSYMMREFARHITAVDYQVTPDDSSLYRAKKLDKHTWQLPVAKAGQLITVHYEVYCYDLSVRTAYVDQQRLYGNFTSLALAVENQEHSPVQVNLIVPYSFLAKKNLDNIKLACGLAATHLHSDAAQGYALQADSYHELIDYPFEIAVQDQFSFIIQDGDHQTLSHHFYLSGKHCANMGRLQQDVTQICQTYLDWLGSAPFSDYTFMTFASGQDYGGLEHINSTSLITPRNDLPLHNESDIPSSAYQRFLGLCSHEYFHAWWVKTVRPDVMLEVDLRHEAFTPLLWVFEGFTSYVDDFMLQASGVIDKRSYLILLAEQISRYYQTQGRAYQSVAESSFDAWIKLYRSDENTGNAGISYYNKGALVALCLDLILLNKSAGQYRLFDVIKAFYSQAKKNDNHRIGVSSADIGEVICQFIAKADWDDFEQRYVNGVEELPLEQLLTDNGIIISIDPKDTAAKHVPLGMRCSETAEGLKVNKVNRNSAAAQAGISAHDTIIALDGLKANNKQLAIVIEAKRDVDCHLFRRDELMTVTIKFNIKSETTDDEQDKVDITHAHKVNLRMEESGFEQWLSPDFVKA